MPNRQIGPINNRSEILNLLDDELLLAQVPGDSTVSSVSSAVPGKEVVSSKNVFDDVLAKAIDFLNGVSQSEYRANQLVSQYLNGEAQLHQVMAAQAKMSVQVQLAVTAINSAVTTFKEVTQMQV